MSPRLVKLFALLLLVAQGVAGVVPGRVLCIPLPHCHAHANGGLEYSESHAGRYCGEHEHGPLSLASHASDECGCHVHVPVPGEQPLPAAPRGEVVDARPALTPAVVVLLAHWAGDAPRVGACLRPPDWSATGQVRALKATRLLI
ncbi:MAG: hypothetical protein AMXMBFR77_03580 [Phycisphaerales bacterium]|nr:hypothetical protein [Phycisphaerales bacterium]MDL1904183.1 hypothetical protein [Synechococcales cyanobacterium CNB]GIK19127.1 MAG: hypothetical protein BroJett004_12910 [Planctomycetota bacterium]